MQIFTFALLTVFPIAGILAAPVPRPFEDILPGQIPDPGLMQNPAYDSSQTLPTTLASSWDPNDTSPLNPTNEKF